MIILPDSQTLRHLPFHEGVQSRAGLGRKLREGLLNEPFLALPDRHTEQAAKPLRSGRLDTPRPQVIVCSKLKGFGFRVEGTNSLAQPSDQNGFVPGAKWAETEVLAKSGGAGCARSTHHQSTLRLEHQSGWPDARPHCRPHLHVDREIARRIGTLQQHGEAETSYPRLVTEQFEFVWIERPTLGEFVGMSRPLHGLLRCTRLKL